ncbi:DNA helicase [Sulfitobacter mediterraneus]|uniref:DNA helicase n=1 Tax=Sulfitobacter mediterraneus TaxID=83219 RepID=UPI001933E50B|nr:DNA helicase [Sulfitobacter mediterraneus]MBM1634400.1 DNA helicase [Sulfitobacter mediterraneus]MBM1642217.1 DNA helicase [Sulfitobacter mediterraneus]MBM1646266.1 DNA helicase [Sulfitobacter mediterraneus]MBM1650312.1 DNA helicase [Sulfitobacter mediterraneus]MBM1654334.1 DNA helicase [Sulfitobacter mediterraneus]
MLLSAPIFVLKRKARQLSRTGKLSHSAALDRIAVQEGFQNWSHLAKRDADTGRAARLLAQLQPGDLVLVAARPGEGKTLLALEILAEAAATGQGASFFTLEYSEETVRGLLAETRLEGRAIKIDTSDGICAGHIVETHAAAPKGGVIVIDYLQRLCESRSTPDLDSQLATLKDFAKARGQTIICLSQIDRRFVEAGQNRPGLADVRLADPADLRIFDRCIFLNAGKISLQAFA